MREIIVLFNTKAQKQARKLQATLVQNYDSLTHLLADGGEVKSY